MKVRQRMPNTNFAGREVCHGGMPLSMPLMHRFSSKPAQHSRGRRSAETAAAIAAAAAGVRGSRCEGRGHRGSSSLGEPPRERDFRVALLLVLVLEIENKEERQGPPQRDDVVQRHVSRV